MKRICQAGLPRISSDVTSTPSALRVILNVGDDMRQTRRETTPPLELGDFFLFSLDDFLVMEFPPLPDTLGCFDLGDAFEVLCRNITPISDIPLSPDPLADFLRCSPLRDMEL